MSIQHTKIIARKCNKMCFTITIPKHCVRLYVKRVIKLSDMLHCSGQAMTQIMRMKIIKMELILKWPLLKYR